MKITLLAAVVWDFLRNSLRLIWREVKRGIMCQLICSKPTTFVTVHNWVLGSFRLLSTIIPRYPKNTPQISSRYIPAISQISLRISPKICQKYHPEIKIFPRRHKDIPNILPTPYISPRYPQDVPIYPKDMSKISAKISLSPRYSLGISQISGLVWSALKGFEQCGTLKPKCRELTGLVHLWTT